MVSHWCPCIRPSAALSFCHTSVHPYFGLRTITWVNINGFLLNDMCIDIMGSGLGLLMSKFRQFLTVICL